MLSKLTTLNVEKIMKEEMICKDLANVFNEARKMGCKKVKSFRDIPLVNVAVVIAALYKQVPKEVQNIHPAEVRLDTKLKFRRIIMEIVDRSNNETLCFESLELEDVFKFDSRIFMKVSNNGDGEINAYDFSKSRLTDISEDTLVQYIPSELILHERGWGLDN